MILPENSPACALAVSQRVGVSQGDHCKWREKRVAIGTTNFNGSYGYGSISGNSNSFGTASVVRAPTASAAATIVMFRANEPGAQGAFEAEQY